nr:hypothetical protein Iba_scaffold2431CG0290 [Ipomoea batatas]GME10085.1 hypothetical protein Iba_scaffold9478CG0040 [Ipomoea batatas]
MNIFSLRCDVNNLANSMQQSEQSKTDSASLQKASEDLRGFGRKWQRNFTGLSLVTLQLPTEQASLSESLNSEFLKDEKQKKPSSFALSISLYLVDPILKEACITGDGINLCLWPFVSAALSFWKCIVCDSAADEQYGDARFRDLEDTA